MMMKAAKLGWAGAGQKQGRSRLGAKQERGRSMSRAVAGQEQGRNWGGARNVPVWSLIGAGREYGRVRVEAGAG